MADTDFKLNAFTAKRISDMAKQLSLTDKAIARMLNINHCTVGRAVRVVRGIRSPQCNYPGAAYRALRALCRAVGQAALFKRALDDGEAVL